ncbi:hypothetical protein ACFQX6_47405 [Streptosporangium lutulentum]
MRAATIGVPLLVVLTGLLVARCVAAGPAEHSAGSHLSSPGGRVTVSAPRAPHRPAPHRAPSTPPTSRGCS